MYKKSKHAFTLIEVMIAVLIISTVIMALLTMRGNYNHIFTKLSKSIQISQISSFLIGDNNYGFNSKKISLDRFLENFKLDDNLRRKLKKNKIKITYKKLDIIDFDNNIILELGKSTIYTKKSSSSLLRIRLQ